MATYELKPGTFNSSMNAIVHGKSMLIGAYREFESQVEALRNLWKSKKGWEHIATFEMAVTNRVDGLDSNIEMNYRNIKSAAEGFAKVHEQVVNVPDIMRVKCEFNKKDYTDTNIKVKVNESYTKVGDIEKRLKRMGEALDAIEEACHNGNTAQFGFGESDGNNSVAKSLMNHVKNVHTALNSDYKSFLATLDQRLATDEAAMKAQEQQAAKTYTGEGF